MVSSSFLSIPQTQSQHVSTWLNRIKLGLWLKASVEKITPTWSVEVNSYMTQSSQYCLKRTKTCGSACSETPGSGPITVVPLSDTGIKYQNKMTIVMKAETKTRNVRLCLMGNWAQMIVMVNTPSSATMVSSRLHELCLPFVFVLFVS